MTRKVLLFGERQRQASARWVRQNWSRGLFKNRVRTDMVANGAYKNLATFAAIRMQINLLQFSHICALFRLHLEGGTSQQPFKSCLASLG